MEHLEQHDMELQQVHPSGEEEWFCPVCGRRFLMTWPPAYKKVILDVGDEQVVHNGRKGGVRMASPNINEQDEPFLSEELRHELEDFREDIDFDNLLGGAD
jgi:hypothetical protein